MFRVVLKEQFRIDPCIPPAKLEPVKPHSLDFVPDLEERVMAEHSSADVEDAISGMSLGPATAPSSGTTARASAAPWSVVDAQAAVVASFTEIGADAALLRLALVKYSAEDQQTLVLDFCDHFKSLRGLVPGASDDLIAAALWMNDGEKDWLGVAANELLSLQ